MTRTSGKAWAHLLCPILNFDHMLRVWNQMDRARGGDVPQRRLRQIQYHAFLSVRIDIQHRVVDEKYE